MEKLFRYRKPQGTSQKSHQLPTIGQEFPLTTTKSPEETTPTFI
jgi:hypothetical protein